MSIPHIYNFSESQILSLNNTDFIVIDVRNPDEYEESHIDSAQNIPLTELVEQYNRLPRDKKILLYCRSGNRSQQAYDFLIQHEFDAHNIGSFFNLSDNIIKKLN